MATKKDGCLKLIDFGFACLTLPDRDLSCILRAQGTPEYIAPEIYEGNVSTLEELKACDVWSLGICFYELTNGKFPFPQAETITELYGYVTKGRFDDSEYPYERINDIIYKALIRNPVERPTVKELLEMVNNLE